MANIVGNFRVSKIFNRDRRYTDVALSWSTKQRNQDGEDEFVWSSESFRLIGNAHEAFSGMDEGDWITLEGRNASHTNIPYDKEGERVWVNPRNLVFDFSPMQGRGAESKPENRSLLAEDVGTTPPEDDIPF